VAVAGVATPCSATSKDCTSAAAFEVDVEVEVEVDEVAGVAVVVVVVPVVAVVPVVVVVPIVVVAENERMPPVARDVRLRLRLRRLGASDVVTLDLVGEPVANAPWLPWERLPLRLTDVTWPALALTLTAEAGLC